MSLGGSSGVVTPRPAACCPQQDGATDVSWPQRGGLGHGDGAGGSVRVEVGLCCRLSPVHPAPGGDRGGSACSDGTPGVCVRVCGGTSSCRASIRGAALLLWAWGPAMSCSPLPGWWGAPCPAAMPGTLGCAVLGGTGDPGLSQARVDGGEEGRPDTGVGTKRHRCAGDQPCSGHPWVLLAPGLRVGRGIGSRTR